MSFKQENSDYKFKLLTALFCGAVGAAFLLVFAAFLLYHSVDVSFLTNFSCQPGETYIYCFYDEQWDSETYLSVITEFYGVIITVLTALLAVVAAFAFFVVKGSAKEWTEQAAIDEARRYLETSHARELIRDQVIANINAVTDDLDVRLSSIEDHFQFYDRLEPGKLKVDDEKTTE